MIIDYSDKDAPADIRCDVCIVGAGPAGIALACALADTGLDIALVESGGFEPDGQTQALYAGESVGQDNASPLYCRLRYFGGTTNHWQGWCAPLAPEDFEQRPWVPHSGWPIGLDELGPYYAPAREWCEIGPAVNTAAVTTLPAFNTDRLSVSAWQFSPPTRFGKVYRDRLSLATRVRVHLNCNVTRIVTDASAREVERLEVATLAGKRGSVRAGAFVLACGGMENTRMLLLAADVEPTGLGNRSGVLGRFFMQHIEAPAARLEGTGAAVLGAAFDHRKYRSGELRLHPKLAPVVQRKDALLGTGFSITTGVEPSAGMAALRGLWSDAEAGNWPDDFGSRLVTVLSDLDGLAGDLYRRASGDVVQLRIGVIAEQAPDPGSRISLATTRDPFGLPSIRVDWRPTASDRRSIEGSLAVLAAELGRLGLGRMQLEPWLRDTVAVWPERLWGGCHHMGTTRMSADAATGIVDINSRVHTVDNLYIAGSSVFPTGGYVPPTLTIVALALRLADHLKERYA